MSKSIAYYCLRHIYLVQMDSVLCYNGKFLAEFKAFCTTIHVSDRSIEHISSLTHEWNHTGWVEMRSNFNNVVVMQAMKWKTSIPIDSIWGCYFNRDLILCNNTLLKPTSIDFIRIVLSTYGLKKCFLKKQDWYICVENHSRHIPFALLFYLAIYRYSKLLELAAREKKLTHKRAGL